MTKITRKIYLKDFVFKQKCIPWSIRAKWKSLMLQISAQWVRLKPFLNLFWKTFPENPINAIRFFPKLVRDEISDHGFVLFVCGQKVLEDALEASQGIGLKPFLVLGTLRGFILKKDFLPRSEDIDFGLLSEDFQKKHLIKEILLKKGYKHCIDDAWQLQLVHPKFPDLVIDFFHVYKKNGCMVISGLTDDHKMLTSCYFPPETFYEFCMVDFRLRKVLIPSDPEKFLSVHYGEEWKNPQRKFHYRYERKNMKIEAISPDNPEIREKV